MPMFRLALAGWCAVAAALGALATAITLTALAPGEPNIFIESLRIGIYSTTDVLKDALQRLGSREPVCAMGPYLLDLLVVTWGLAFRSSTASRGWRYATIGAAFLIVPLATITFFAMMWPGTR